MTINVIFIIFALSVGVESEVCKDAGFGFRRCEENKILTRVTQDGPSASLFQNVRHLSLEFPDDIEVASNAFSEVNLTIISLKFPSIDNQDKTTLKTLKLHPDSFAHLSNLTFLLVNFANINFEGNPLAHLGLLNNLALTNGNLTELVPEMFACLPNLEKLDLQNNRIERFPGNVFMTNVHLKYINLRLNKITKLEPGWANGLNSLERLDLLGNSIAGEPGLFLGIQQHVKELELAKAFDSNGFQQHLIEHFPSLTYLGLAWSNLTTLTPGMFDGCPVLRQTVLAGNHLRNVPTGIFEKLTSLKEITFISNEIETIERGAFSSLNLNDLVLSMNNIKAIEPRTFSGLKVRWLELDHNKISEVKPNAFDGLNAYSVDLSHNKVTQIGADDFSGLKTENLDLSTNDIQETAEGAFKNTKLSRLGLIGTPIRTVNKPKLGLSESVEIIM